MGINKENVKKFPPKKICILRGYAGGNLYFPKFSGENIYILLKSECVAGLISKGIIKDMLFSGSKPRICNSTDFLFKTNTSTSLNVRRPPHAINGPLMKSIKKN